MSLEWSRMALDLSRHCQLCEVLASSKSIFGSKSLQLSSLQGARSESSRPI
jgi:hypothetical protein